MVKKGTIIFIIVFFCIIVSVILVYSQQQIIDTNKIDIVLDIDENSIYDDDNIVNCTLKVQNSNRFGIVLFGSEYKDESLYFDAACEGVYIINPNESIENSVSFEFNENINKNQYLSLIREKELTFSFNINKANQGENTIIIYDIDKNTEDV